MCVCVCVMGSCESDGSENTFKSTHTYNIPGSLIRGRRIKDIQTRDTQTCFVCGKIYINLHNMAWKREWSGGK